MRSRRSSAEPGRTVRRQRSKRPTARPTISRAERVMAIESVRASKARRRAAGFGSEILDLVHSLAKALFDPYRPELHYMRGPGPKWHAKHDPAPAMFNAVPIPALVRVRAKRR